MKRVGWIVTKVADGGDQAVVVGRYRTASAAAEHACGIPNAGWEGPVPLDAYPVGRTWSTDESGASQEASAR